MTDRGTTELVPPVTDTFAGAITMLDEAAGYMSIDPEVLQWTSTPRSAGSGTPAVITGKPIELGERDIIGNEELLELDVDLLIPAVLENRITGVNAARVVARRPSSRSPTARSPATPTPFCETGGRWRSRTCSPTRGA